MQTGNYPILTIDGTSPNAIATIVAVPVGDDLPWDLNHTWKYKITKGSFTNEGASSGGQLTITSSMLAGAGVYELRGAAMGYTNDWTGYKTDANSNIIWSAPSTFILARMNTFTLTDLTVANNSKQDTTNDDGTPTNNVLYVAEDMDGQATISIDLTYMPDETGVGNIFHWQIDDGADWSSSSGDFSSGQPIESIWTDSNPGGTVNREFTVTVHCECGGIGTCACRRMLKITVLKIDLDGQELQAPPPPQNWKDVPDDQEVDPGVLLVTAKTRLLVQDPGVNVGKYKLSWTDPAPNKHLKLVGPGGPNSPIEVDCAGPWPKEYKANAGGNWDYTDSIEVTLEHSLVDGSDMVKLVGVKVDLDCDGNHDGVVTEEDDPLEEIPGAYACVTNASCSNRFPLALQKVQKAQPEWVGNVELKVISGAEKIKVFADQTGGTALTLPFTTANAVLPLTYWVEGQKVSETEGDVVFVATAIGLDKSDTNKFTVYKLDLDADIDMDGDITENDEDIEDADGNPGLLVGVNNNTHTVGDDETEVDYADEIINAGDKENDLKVLRLKLNPKLTDGNLILRCAGNSNVRIFDETDTAVIGPEQGAEHTIPAASVPSGGLEYRIEALAGGHEASVELEYRPAAGADAIQDTVKASTVNMTGADGYCFGSLDKTKVVAVKDSGNRTTDKCYVFPAKLGPDNPAEVLVRLQRGPEITDLIYWLLGLPVDGEGIGEYDILSGQWVAPMGIRDAVTGEGAVPLHYALIYDPMFWMILDWFQYMWDNNDPEVRELFPQRPTAESLYYAILNYLNIAPDDVWDYWQMPTITTPGTKQYCVVDASGHPIQSIHFTVLNVDLDIYRLEGNKVDEDKDHTEGSITRVLNPNKGETAGTGKAKGVSLKLEASIESAGILLTYKLSLEDICSVANDMGLVRVYRSSGSEPVCIINNCPPASDTEEYLTENELSDEFWIEFEGGGIVELKLAACSDSTELFADSVRVCAIGCQPRIGRILYVKSGGSGSAPYNDYVDSAAGSVASALAIDTAHDNIVVSSANYSESSLLIDKIISLGGLGLRWEENTELTTDWQLSAPYRPKFSLLPNIQPSSNSRVLEIAAGVSSVYLGSFEIRNGNQTGSGGGGLRVAGVAALGIFASKFSQNKTDKTGGAISFSPPTGMTGLLLMEDSEVSGNEAFQGGAGMAAFDKGSVTFKRTRFLSNKTIRNDNNGAMGGAVLAWESEGNWQIEKCIFDSNTVREEGSNSDPIYNVGGCGGACLFAKGSPKVNVSDTVFRMNLAQSKKNRADGGAIAFGTDFLGPVIPDEAIFSRCKFDGNEAGGDIASDTPSRSSGGAVYLLYASAFFEDCEFLLNSVWGKGVGPLPVPPTSTGLTFKPDKITYGGAIAGHMNSSIRASNTKFEKNTSIDCGGAIGIVGESEAITGETSAGLDITDQTIDLEGCTFVENTSEYHGAAIAGASKKSGGNIQESTFTDNKVGIGVFGVNDLVRTRDRNGTAICIDADGGAISYQAAISSSLTVSETEFSGNIANGGGGAVKHGGGANASYSQCAFLNNKSLSDGGAARVSTAANVAFEGCEFTGNEAGINVGSGNPGTGPAGNIEGHGGVISLDYAQVALSSCTLSANKSGTTAKPRQGGALYVSTGLFNKWASCFFIAFPSFTYSTILTASDTTINQNTATEFGGACAALITDTDWIGGTTIQFNECEIESNEGSAVLQTAPPASDPDDPAQSDPATQGLFVPRVLNNPIDAFYIIENAETGLGNVKFKLLKSTVKAKNGSSGVAAYLEANLGHDELESTIQETTFDGFAVGVVSRYSDIKALDDCEFKYSVQNPASPKDVIVLDGKGSGQKNEQQIRIKQTKFSAHSGATAVLVVRIQAAADDLDIQAENNHFEGRQHASPPANAPIVHGNGAIVVLSRATSSVDASPNYWDHADGPFVPGSLNPLGSYASRLVIYAPYLTSVPPGVGP